MNQHQRVSLGALSNIPAELLQEIFSLLPLKDAVRAAAASKYLRACTDRMLERSLTTTDLGRSLLRHKREDEDDLWNFSLGFLAHCASMDEHVNSRPYFVIGSGNSITTPPIFMPILGRMGGSVFCSSSTELS
jgi:hypothetical protein